MATLYLIRHGQAGFGQAEYDVLSTLGAAQAQALGRYFVMAQRPLDRLYSAPRRRHLATCDNLCQGLLNAGGSGPSPWPDSDSHAAAATDSKDAAAAPSTRIVHDFDEFPFAEILATACGPGGLLAAEYEALLAELAGRNPLHDGRAFGRLFRMAMPRWAAGDVTVSESFEAFCQRVARGLLTVAAQTATLPSGHAAAVVTSAGAIAAALRYLLGVDNTRMLSLCLALYNTGVTELRVRRVTPVDDHGDDHGDGHGNADSPPGDGLELSLISINGVPHLLDPPQRTFR